MSRTSHPSASVAPARARARPSRPERFFVGRRPQTTEVYLVRGTKIGPLRHPGYRSDAPFDWGEPTAGSLELAFAMLAHTTDSRPPDPVCLAFSADVVSRLDRAGFVLPEGDIALWLLTAFRDGSPGESPAAGTRSARARAMSWLRSRFARH